MALAKSKRASPLLKLLFASCLSTSHWPKQLTWLSQHQNGMELQSYMQKGMDTGKTMNRDHQSNHSNTGNIGQFYLEKKGFIEEGTLELSVET